MSLTSADYKSAAIATMRPRRLFYIYFFLYIFENSTCTCLECFIFAITFKVPIEHNVVTTGFASNINKVFFKQIPIYFFDIIIKVIHRSNLLLAAVRPKYQIHYRNKDQRQAGFSTFSTAPAFNISTQSISHPKICDQFQFLG